MKYVPDAAAQRRFEADDSVDRVNVDGLLCELDEYAVEQALQIKEKLADGTEITALTVGPAEAANALRKALQMGVDKAVHVLDEAIAGSDALATSLILAEAIKKLPHDLTVCGMASTDGSMGVLPAMLSERLGIAGATLGSSVEVDGTTVRIRRDGEVATQTVEATLPVVLSVTDQTGEARYPSFKGIMAAKKKSVEVWALSDLGVDPASVGLSAAWSAVESIEARPPRSRGEIVHNDDGSGAGALVEFLASKKFI